MSGTTKWNPSMMVDDKDLYDEIMKDPEVQAEIKKIEPEFNLLRQILRCRKEAGLTQTQVAERMGTTQSGLSRIEAGRKKPFNKRKPLALAGGEFTPDSCKGKCPLCAH